MAPTALQAAFWEAPCLSPAAGMGRKVRKVCEPLHGLEERIFLYRLEGHRDCGRAQLLVAGIPQASVGKNWLPTKAGRTVWRGCSSLRQQSEDALLLGISPS